MTTIALAPRAAPSLFSSLIPRDPPSLYSGMILALIALAFALQASFIAGLADGGRGFSASPPPLIETAATSLPTPCATP
ncbi:MAG TPA: hypothetical protein VFK90_11590 [Anaeromyxobacter sp.]|nr:hypothetical protein [Anaeromyxobacter sp.]